jgi:hypothetical protein
MGFVNMVGIIQKIFQIYIILKFEINYNYGRIWFISYYG